jgi:hypothetical protein
MGVKSKSVNAKNVKLDKPAWLLLAGLLVISLTPPDARAKAPRSQGAKPVVVFPASSPAPVPPTAATHPEAKTPLPDGDDTRSPLQPAPESPPERLRTTLHPEVEPSTDQSSVPGKPSQDAGQPDSPEDGRVEPAQPDEGQLQEGQLDEVRPERVPSSEADRVYDRMTPLPPEKRSGIQATTRNERGELVYLSPRRDTIPMFSTDSAHSSPAIHTIAAASMENYNALFQADKPEKPASDRLRRARELAWSGRRREAIDLLKEPLPDRLQAAQRAYLLGTLHEELGNITEALSYLQEAARLQPDSADTWYNLGLTCELAGKKDQAYQHYRQAQILEPDAADIREALERTLP